MTRKVCRVGSIVVRDLLTVKGDDDKSTKFHRVVDVPPAPPQPTLALTISQIISSFFYSSWRHESIEHFYVCKSAFFYFHFYTYHYPRSITIIVGAAGGKRFDFHERNKDVLS